jgi:hypothetical protein
MDAKGTIHEFSAGPAGAAEREQAERAHGRLEPIPPLELPAVRAMTEQERRAWYRAKQERREQRKRARAARKRGRR